MPNFEITLDGVPVGIASSIKFPKVWPDIDMNQPGEYKLSADCILKVKPDNSIKCGYTQTCSPKEKELVDLWLEGAKREPNQSIGFQFHESGESPMKRFLDSWKEILLTDPRDEKKSDPLAPGEMRLIGVSHGYSISAPFTKEPRLEVPFTLKWHSRGVSVIGADGIHFTQDFFDGPFRSGRIARKWARNKVKTQDTQIVGHVGTLQGMTFHTGAPKLDDPILKECATPANTMDTNISVRDMVAQLEELYKGNPHIEWKWPNVSPQYMAETPDGQPLTYEIHFGVAIRNEPARAITINQTVHKDA